MTWYDMVCYDMAWYSMPCIIGQGMHDMTWHGIAFYGMVWHGMNNRAGYDMI